jgi:hypothetical protein
MQKKLLCFILSLFASFSVAMAQVSLSGVVKDKEGPLAGASVVLKGTTVGVITGSDGTFKLSAPNAKTAVLVIKFIGMIGVEYPVNGKPADIKIFMQDDMAQIDDVVVVGYGNALRSNLTGSVGSISSKMLAVMPVSSAGEAMVGKIAGVQVTVADGSPGSEINIRIRGGT